MIPSIFGASLSFSGSSTVGYPWTTRNSVFGYGWSAIACGHDVYGVDLFVAVGGNHSIISYDGINWAIYEIAPVGTFYAVCSGVLDSGSAGLFVAVGTGIYTSADGIIWTEETNPLDPEIATYTGVSQNPVTREYAAISPSKMIYTVAGGTGQAINWTEGADPPSSALCCAYNYNGVFFVGGSFGMAYGSPDSALSSSSLSDQLNAICAIPNPGGGLVAVGNGKVFNIAANATYAEGTIDNTKNWISVAVNQAEIAVALNAGTYTTAAAVSNNGGLTWTTKSAANYSTWAACCWGSSVVPLFVGVASTGIEGDNRIMSAPG
jgi:hypothetical protein